MSWTTEPPRCTHCKSNGRVQMLEHCHDCGGNGHGPGWWRKDDGCAPVLFTNSGKSGVPGGEWFAVPSPERLLGMHAVCQEIAEIMKTYREQEEGGCVDTPGGLEHMGDVWQLLSKWESLVADA